MNVGIIGSGGREHAISHSIKNSKKVSTIYCIPGNAGTDSIGKNVNLELDNFDEIYRFIKNEKIVGQGYNQKEQLKDPTAHAEVIAITSAASTINDWRLDGCIMYVTKEPCVMCSGAIINSRVSTLIFGGVWTYSKQ